MFLIYRLQYVFFFFATVICLCLTAKAQSTKFNVIAFYTAKNDKAHISFVHEANQWFPEAAKKYHFGYDSTTNWDNLNAQFLSKYQVVLFLDTRPDGLAQRHAFETYMKNGGAWMGFHFSAFALTPLSTHKIGTGITRSF